MLLLLHKEIIKKADTKIDFTRDKINGGAFKNKLLWKMSTQLNVFFRTTPGKSTWSNLIIERCNAFLGNMIEQLSN